MRPGATCCRRKVGAFEKLNIPERTQVSISRAPQGQRTSLSTICLMARAVQLLSKVESVPLKVGKAPLFELDGALAHKTRSALCH